MNRSIFGPEVSQLSRLPGWCLGYSLLFALVAMVSLTAHAQTYKIVYAFNGTDDLKAGSSIVRDKAGNLYGASTYGSVRNCVQGPCGAIYKIDSSGKETTLYKFKGPPDGANPVGVTVDAAGTLYGTTEYGGRSKLEYCGAGYSGCGTVFQLTSSGKETVLHSFSQPPGDGIIPQAGVIRDWKGVLYGMTTYGGANSAYGNPGEGTVYKIVNGKESLLYSFMGGSDGALPSAGLLVRDGVLYGTANFGGSGNCVTVFGSGCGTVFKLEGSTETTLYSFNNQTDGGFPAASLIADKSGNLYGTTVLGGDLSCQISQGNPPGCGVVFKITPSGEESVLYTFTDTTDGAWPSAALVMDSAGNLYGTAFLGGDSNCDGGTGCGTVFKVDSGGTFSVLHTFEGSDGQYPTALIEDGRKLYGTASGGPDGNGVVYELTP